MEPEKRGLKPFGRALGDFFDDDGKLPEAEEKLRQAARRGEFCELGPSNTPPENTPATLVRAGFLRFLVLGGDDDAPVHESGPILKGAYIEGLINLDECTAKSSFRLDTCTLEAGLCLTDATLKGFALFKCHICRSDQALFITDASSVSIFADRMKASSSVFIMKCKCDARLSLPLAEIGGDLDLRFNTIAASDGVSVELASARIKGDLPLGAQNNAIDDETDASTFEGCVVIAKADIAGDVFFGKTNIVAMGDDKKAALHAAGTIIHGAFDFRAVSHIKRVSLLGAKAATLLDDEGSWELGRGNHRFSGFTYDRIADDARTLDRRRWLLGQRAADLSLDDPKTGSGLRRQPWQQAAATLETAGDIRGAKALRIALEDQATSNKRGAPWWLAQGWRLLCVYGYRPERLFYWAVAFWLAGFGVFTWAGYANSFAATSDIARKSQAYASCLTANEKRPTIDYAYCKHLDKPDYTAVFPAFYSLDNLIPLIEFGQTKSWEISPHAYGFRAFQLFQHLFGVIAGSALVALIGSYVTRKAS